jgi:cysteine desulfurase
MKKTIYLDNGATTQLDAGVLQAMQPYFFTDYGNASSLHHLGIKAKEALEKARKVIASAIRAKPEEIIFTSGGTEANNLAIRGIARANKQKGNHIITTKIEHDSVLKTCKSLQKEGFNVTYLPVDREGFVNADDLRKAITDKTILVSIVHGNNEIGTIQDLQALGKICSEAGVLFHTDACQSFTKTELDVEKQNLHLVTLNAHKIHGPKGVGALFIRKGTAIQPLIYGGGHESALRSGTENIPGIVGFAEAVKLALASEEDKAKMERLRDKLIEGCLRIPGSRLNGPKVEGPRSKRLCNNVNVSFLGIEGEAISGHLDQFGICSSTGSACSSKQLEASHVLKGIGLSDEEAHGSLRLTLSRFNTDEEIDFVLKKLPLIVRTLREISPLGGI